MKVPLIRIFTRDLGDRVIVAAQNPVELDNYSEPEPELALLEPKADFYDSGHPKPGEVFLIVEVADNTIKYDREIKIPLYGENNIIEVWLVDINEQCLEVYRQATARGYRQVQKLRRGQNLSIQQLSDLNFKVDEILR